MSVTHLLLLAATLEPSPQGPAPGEVGKFRWPPTSASTLRYAAEFTKERKLPRDLAKAERDARKRSGLFAPGRAPRQRVEIGMDIALAVTEERVVGKYTTRLGKHSLRMAVPRPEKTGSPRGTATSADSGSAPLLGNSWVNSVWGLPGSKNEEKMSVARAGIERTFEHAFKTAGNKGAAPGDLREKFGDHLIPVLWVHPLPCWIGTLVGTMELGGEAVIGGKQIIRDGSLQLATGYRKTRVEGKWTKASAAGFTLEYKLQVEEFIAKERSARTRTEAMTWVFEVDGVATYSFADAAWESITEKVTARPKELSAARLRALHDEVFSGTIEIQRVRETKGRKRRRRR